MSLVSIPGQPRTKRFLKQLLQSGHIPHALLFSGMAGVGKTAVARELAKALNCLSPRDEDSCDTCPSCGKIDRGNHPDLLWVQKDGAFIKLDQIRELRDRVRFRPFEGRWRVVVLQDANNLKEEAGNSLLKLLEEPPGQNIFVLTTVEPQQLLSTLVSRCCHIRFQPLDDSLVLDYLTRTFDLPTQRAREIARLAEGSLERAKWLAEENRMARWNEVIRNLISLESLPILDLFPLVLRWIQASEDLEQDLECIKLWVRDLLLARTGVEDRITFGLDSRLRSVIQRVSIERLFLLYEHIEQAIQHLRLNANKQLTLEGVCLAIRDELYGQSYRNPLSTRR